MRIVLFAILAASAGQAAAEGSCTFTYNIYAKRIESTCTGVPAAPLGLNERAALQIGTYKQCVVAVEKVSPTQVKAKPAVCK